MGRALRKSIDKTKENLKRFGIGATYIAFGIFSAISLISFDIHDPSINLISSNAIIKNWGGSLGAYLSVPVIQIFGLGSAIFAVLPLIWGYKVIKDEYLPSIWLRVAMACLALPSFSALSSLCGFLVDVPKSWPSDNFGGFFGAMLQRKLSASLTIFGFSFAAISATVVSWTVASGMEWSKWLKLSVIFKLLTELTTSLTYWLKDRLEAILDYEPKVVAPAKTKKKKVKAEIEEDEEEIEDEEEDESSSEPTINKGRADRKINSRKEKPKVLIQEEIDLDEEESDFELPSVSLLQKVPKNKGQKQSSSSLSQNAELLEKVLEDFGVSGKITEINPGPVVTLYALETTAGTRASRVIGLADDIARNLSSVSSRIAVIPGKNLIGIELPNATRETVYFREMIDSEEFHSSEMKLPLVLGKNIAGDPVIIDLAKTPHLLVAGTTGSGKSVGINAMILSLLYRFTPDECKFIMIDPKMLELSIYKDIPHLLTPVVTEPAKAVVALKWIVKEMESRYRLMSNQKVRNIEGYNTKIKEAVENDEVLERQVQTGFDPETGKPIFETQELDMSPMPYIVVIVDEMADLMMVAGKEIEASVQRLAQMARAAGIHLILATQRPSVDVITGTIKANFPSRISFQVTTKIDSRTILGEQGAEQLLGMGDMLYMAGGGRIVRVHGPFVADDEVEKVVDHLREQGEPDYIDEVTEDSEDEDGEGYGDDEDDGRDELYHKAVEIVRREGKASTSFIQRSLRIGYNRAATIIELMEKDGVVSRADHVGRREVLAA